MPLTTQDVQHIAKLSRLHLTDDEIEKYRGQLDTILTYIEKLQEIDTTGVPELQHTQEVINVFREDVIDPSNEATREQLLKNFSNRQGDLLEVQAVFSREEQEKKL